MVGNTGKTNPICFYHGKIRSIRISKGQRYAADFEPDLDFRPDDTAVLIYSAQLVDGDKGGIITLPSAPPPSTHRRPAWLAKSPPDAEDFPRP